jgi:hypothetical protein
MNGLGYEGRLASTMLGVFYTFIVSAQLIATTLPFLVFDRLVGWQHTQVALWLGVASLLPVGPGMFATLSSVRDHAAERGYPGRPVRRFRSSFARAVRTLWWWWLGLATVEVVVGYDVLLLGATDSVFLVAVAFVGVLVATTIALVCVVLDGASGRPTAVLAAALAAVASRPHIALAWLFLVLVAVATTMLPVVGASLALFVPALCAWAVLIVNTAFGFNERVR